MSHIPAVEVPDDAVSACDRVVYQYTGHVQPHAALVVVDAVTLRVEQASASTRSVLGVAAEELVGSDLTSLEAFGDRASWGPAASRAREREPSAGPALRAANGGALLTRVHRVGDRMLIEIEPETDGRDVDGALADVALEHLIAALRDVPNLERAAEVTARIAREHLGYDRCMVYRFDEDWNGEVIGESRSARTADSFLGLRFPSHDIPASARRLYELTGVRVTVDQDADGSPLVPMRDPETGEHTDLTHVRCRNTAGACRTYYQNMGVRATLVLPVLVRGRVWGHLGFHHEDARRPSPELDGMLQGLASVFADAIARLALLEREQAQDLAESIRLDITDVDGSWEAYQRRAVLHLPRLRELLLSDAVALKLGDEFHADGSPIDRAAASAIVEALSPTAVRGRATSARLLIDHPALRGVADRFAGALLIRIGDGWGDYLLALRGEKRQETSWAGNPQEGLAWDAKGRPRLAPRRSFAAYIAQTEQSSRAWDDRDVLVAASCAQNIGLQLMRHQAAISARAQTSFLANVSHEIRTPMTAILGFADLLASEGGAAEDETLVRDAVRTIRGNAQHLLTVINDILDICKVEAGKMDKEVRPTNVIELVTDATDLLRGRAEGKGLDLRVESASALPERVQTDPTRLRQIVLNLVGNAIKFTETGGVRVELSCDPKAEMLRLRVRDTGIGMSADQLERVRRFEVFHQGDVSMTRRFGGTGLGLSISNSLAELLGGSLRVESSPGSGSVFDALISTGPIDRHALMKPERVEAFLEACRAADAERPDADLEASPLEGLRVLLVEDGPDNQRLIGFHLRRAGASVELAENGRIAVDRMGKEPERAGVDLVLMDMQMPEMDGYDATRWLRRAGHGLPVLALTAHAMTGDEAKCLEAGCNAYLTKPIDAGRLIKTVRAWGRASGRGEAA